MSFVNLLESTVYTEADIINRTEAMVHSVTPVQAEIILNRKLTGQIAGQYTMTLDEQAELAAYIAACNAARQAGVEARADMARLNAVLAHEAALQRLALPLVTEPATATVYDGQGNASVVANPAIAADAQERLEAQALIDAATPDTLDLYALRHPVVEVQE